MPEHDWQTCPIGELVIALEKRLLAVICEKDKRYEQRFLAQEKATVVADQHAEKWRAQANEWRAAMTDREREFLSKNMGTVLAALSIIAVVLAVFDRLK